ncbi:putative endonuclease or glycosyl hydrolase [Raphanus sativus]|nr:putative endonuclease or glycosyl hydrolase [Raphanus sativus]
MASYSEPYVSNGTGVFWDMDQCKIPAGRTSSDLVPFLREMMLSVGLRGPTSIRIYGDLTGLDFQASASEDVKLNHFHAGEKRAKMTKILEDIVSWSAENPEPSLGIMFLGHLEEADYADITEVTELLETQKNYHFVIVTAPPPPPPMVVFLRSIPRGGL